MQSRSNEAWLAALRGGGAGDAEVVRELESFLRGVVGRLAGARLGSSDVPELVQESLLRIVSSLDAFRGDSAFTTWAAAVATRAVFGELRRRRTREREVSFETLVADVRELPEAREPSPEACASHGQLLAALEHAIANRLTERQRIAVMAELRGVPTLEIAERLGTNSNALYKLVHDARKQLKRALTEAGFDGTTLHEGLEEAPRWP